MKPFFWQIKMKNAELEKHIASLGKLMESAYAKYEASNCFNDLGEAHAWRMRMEAAIASRSPAQVACIEA